jgi:carbohydrate diacid regulator
MIKLAEVLHAHVSVCNDQDLIVASTVRDYVGRLHGSLADDLNGTGTCVPFPHPVGSFIGKVVIHDGHRESGLSPRLTGALVEMVVNQVATAEWLPAQTELKNKFVYDLLHGRLDDEESIIREGQILGMDFTQPRAVMLVDISGAIPTPNLDGSDEPGNSQYLRTRQLAHIAISSIVGFFELPDDTVCAHIGGGEVVVLKAVSAQTLRRWADTPEEGGPADSWVDLIALRRAATALASRLARDMGLPVPIGIGRFHGRSRGLIRSYEDARIALNVGRKFYGDDGVYSIDALGLLAFVSGADERTKQDLAQHLLYPLDGEPDLLATLAAFFEQQCCASTTASGLSIHRNTLNYRLSKIAGLVGLDPRNFDDAIQLRIALMLQSSRRQSAPDTESLTA